MHPNPRRVLPVILILALLGAGAWYFFGRPAVADTGVIAASGTIEATQINISPELSGRVKAVYVSEGDRVTAGDVLIQFDTALLEAQRVQAEAALQVATANYQSLTEGAVAEQLGAAVAQAELQVLSAQQAVDVLQDSAALAAAQAQQTLAQAQKQLDELKRKLRNLTNPDVVYYEEQYAKAQDRVTQAQQNLEKATIGDLAKAVEIAEETLQKKTDQLNDVLYIKQNTCPTCDKVFAASVGRFINLEDAQQEYDDAVNALRTARINLEQAQINTSQAVKDAQDVFETAENNLNAAQTGPKDVDHALAEANVALAEAALNDAQTRAAELAAGPDPDQLALAQSRLASAQAALQAAQAALSPGQREAAKSQMDAARAAVDLLDVQIGKLTLTAPTDGVVLARSIEPGEMAVPGATLLVIADLNRLTLTVYVHEDRYGNVSLEQTAAVTVDSFEGQSFSGTVTYIADKAEFTPRNVQTADGRRTTVFAVRIAIDNPEGKLKPGMPADVTFGQ